jgi:hypothetical protein
LSKSLAKSLAVSRSLSKSLAVSREVSRSLSKSLAKSIKRKEIYEYLRDHSCMFLICNNPSICTHCFDDQWHRQSMLLYYYIQKYKSWWGSINICTITFACLSFVIIHRSGRIALMINGIHNLWHYIFTLKNRKADEDILISARSHLHVSHW